MLLCDDGALHFIFSLGPSSHHCLPPPRLSVPAWLLTSISGCSLSAHTPRSSRSCKGSWNAASRHGRSSGSSG